MLTLLYICMLMQIKMLPNDQTSATKQNISSVGILSESTLMTIVEDCADKKDNEVRALSELLQ